ncbi:MAG: hypothetical protein HFG80_06005 [Eubacterium sp.]|nr:hypothetical protein [Eubacterium sp.]
MDKKLYGAAKFTNKVYNKYGGEKKYDNIRRKEGAIIALIVIAVSLKVSGLVEQKINSYKMKKDCLPKK